MKDQTYYQELGYSHDQINQIFLGIKEGHNIIEQLHPNVDASQFRRLRQILANHTLNVNKIELMIDYVNNKNFNLENLTDEMIEEDINLNLQILSNCTQSEIDILYSENIDYEKKEFLYTNLKTDCDLLDYKDYDIKSLNLIKENIKSGEIEELKKDIYSISQLNYIFNRKNNNKEIFNPEFSVNKMKLIDYFLDNNLNYSVLETYTKEEIDSYSDFLDEDFEIKDFYDKGYNAYQLSYIYKCTACDIDYSVLFNKIEKNCIEDPQEQIYLMKIGTGPITEDNLDNIIQNYTDYLHHGVLDDLLHEIPTLSFHRGMLEMSSVDISPLLKKEYSSEQRNAISTGLLYNIDITQYCDHRYSPKQLEFLIEKLKKKQDITNILNPEYSTKDMDILLYYNRRKEKFNTLEEYKKHYIEDRNKDFEEFTNIYDEFYQPCSTQNFTLISILVNYNKTHDYQINIESLLRNSYINIEKLFEELNNGLDINVIYNSELNPAQQNQIRLGLLHNIDISSYNNPDISAADMEKTRLNLEANISLDNIIENCKEDLNNIQKNEKNNEDFNIDR